MFLTTSRVTSASPRSSKIHPRGNIAEGNFRGNKRSRTLAHSSTNVEQVLIGKRPTSTRKISGSADKLYSRVSKVFNDALAGFRTRHKTKSFAEGAEPQPLSIAENFSFIKRNSKSLFLFLLCSNLRLREPCATFWPDEKKLGKFLSNFNSKVLSFGRRVIDWKKFSNNDNIGSQSVLTLTQ